MFSGPRHHANVHLRTSPARHRPHIWQTSSWRPAAEGDDDYNNYVKYHDDDNDVVNDYGNDDDNHDDSDDGEQDDHEGACSGRRGGGVGPVPSQRDDNHQEPLRHGEAQV